MSEHDNALEHLFTPPTTPEGYLPLNVASVVHYISDNGEEFYQTYTRGVMTAGDAAKMFLLGMDDVMEERRRSQR